MSLRTLLKARRSSIPPDASCTSGSTDTGSALEGIPDRPLHISHDGAWLCRATAPRTLAFFECRHDPTRPQEGAGHDRVIEHEFENEEFEGAPKESCVTVTAIQWISEDHVAVGMSTGLFRLLTISDVPKSSQEQRDTQTSGNGPDAKGREAVVKVVAALRFHPSPLTRIRLSGGLSKYDGDLWLLYQDGVAVLVPVACLIHPGESEDEPRLTYTKYVFNELTQVRDIAIMKGKQGLLECPPSARGGAPDKHRWLCAVGAQPWLAFYTFGSDGSHRYPRSLGGLVTAVRRHVTQAVVGTVGGLVPWGYIPFTGRGRTDKTTPTDPYSPTFAAASGRRIAAAVVPEAVESDMMIGEPSAAPVRRAQFAVLDPSQRLMAVCDSLGRVTVVDVKARHVVRMFKGYRGAQVGWLEAVEQWRNGTAVSGEQRPVSKAAAPDAVQPLGLYLVIYAPSRSVIEIWRMRHGGMIRSLPAPSGKLDLLTVYGYRFPTTGTHRLTESFLVRQRSDGYVVVMRLELGEADLAVVAALRARSTATEDLYLTKQFEERLTGGAALGPDDEAVLLERLERIRDPRFLLQITDLLSRGNGHSNVCSVGVKLHKRAVDLCLKRLSEGKDELDDPFVSSQALSTESSTGASLEAVMTELTERQRFLRAYELGLSMKPDVLTHLLEVAEEGCDRGGDGKEEDEAWTTGVATKGPEWCSNVLKESASQLLQEYRSPMDVPAFITACRSLTGGSRFKTGRGAKRSGVTIQEAFAKPQASREERAMALRMALRPLMADIFAVKTLDDVSRSLRWAQRDTMAAIGEWFLGLPAAVAARLCRSKLVDGSVNPLHRWLSEALERETGRGPADVEEEAVLEPLFVLCRGTDRLEQAMALTTICREVVTTAAASLESRSLGARPVAGKGQRWQRLRRQLRIALLLARRLASSDAWRESPAALESPRTSIWAMLAMDELSFCSSPAEAERLEARCSGAQHRRALLTASPPPGGYTQGSDAARGRDAATSDDAIEAWSPEADREWRVIWKAARAVAHQAPGHLPPPLLMFFSWHNEPRVLACHRARYLASTWPREATLSQVRDHLHQVAVDVPVVAGAVSLDLCRRFIEPWVMSVLGAKDEKGCPPPLLISSNAESSIGACQGLLLYVSRGLSAASQLLGRSSATPVPSAAAAPAGGAAVDPMMCLTPQGLPPLPEAGEIWPITTDAYTHEACQAFIELCSSAATASAAAVWIRLQRSLLRVLQVLAKADLWSRHHPRDLFPADVAWELHTALQTHVKDGDAAKDSPEETEKLASTRRAFILDALEVLATDSNQVVYLTAEALEVPADWVRREHIFILLRDGHDVLAEDHLNKMEDVDAVASRVLDMMRQRLGLAVTSIQSMGGAPVQVLATADADFTQWVQSAAIQPVAVGSGASNVVTDNGRRPLARASTLVGTQNVLIKLQQSIGKPNSPHVRTAQRLEALTQAIIKAFDAQAFDAI